ncbi:hypothetical protein TYRP_004245 [Tyrophagus putrescentiae]|nr:hypothetical protein TYRP_004245 [Tyrophagus putrescentiae]
MPKSRQGEPPAQTSMFVSGAQIKTARSGVTWLTKTPADEGLASGASEVRVGGRFGGPLAVHDLKRRGLTTLGHCERPPTRVSRAERAGPESVGVHSVQVSSGLHLHKFACSGNSHLGFLNIFTFVHFGKIMLLRCS